MIPRVLFKSYKECICVLGKAIGPVEFRSPVSASSKYLVVRGHFPKLLSLHTSKSCLAPLTTYLTRYPSLRMYLHSELVSRIQDEKRTRTFAPPSWDHSLFGGTEKFPPLEFWLLGAPTAAAVLPPWDCWGLGHEGPEERTVNKQFSSPSLSLNCLFLAYSSS